MRIVRRGAIASLFVVVGLVGCGGDDDGSQSTDDATSDASVDTTSEAATDVRSDSTDTSDATDATPACPATGPGRFLDDRTGVLGRFYFGASFTATPVDVVVDRAAGDWGFGTPEDTEVKGLGGSAFTSDHFSVRYLGALVAPTAGTYTLSVATNPALTSDVVKLTIDGAPFTFGSTLTLDPSTPRAFSLEYDHPKAGQSRVSLQWKGPGIDVATTIPKTALRADLRALDQASPAFAGMADGSMPIGVFWPNENLLSSTDKTIPAIFQRTDGHTGWKERGANVLWYNNQWGGGGDLAPMVQVAATLGLKTWRFPADRMVNTAPPADPKKFDADDTTLMAYALEDEAYGKSDWPIDTFLAAAAHARATRAIPIVDGFSGPQLAGLHTQRDIDALKGYLAACDWVAMDYYPLAEFATSEVRTIPAGIDRMAEAIARLIEWSGGKPAFAFVDTSNQKLTAGSRGPTAAEVDAMAFGSLLAGARSISYFPEVPVSGGTNDGTPPDVEAELPKLGKVLQKWAPVLLDEGITVTSRLLPTNFRAAIRKHAGTTYTFVFNDSDKPSTWTSSAGDVLAFYGGKSPVAGEVLAPYQVDITYECTRDKLVFPLP